MKYMLANKQRNQEIRFVFSARAIILTEYVLSLLIQTRKYRFFQKDVNNPQEPGPLKITAGEKHLSENIN